MKTIHLFISEYKFSRAVITYNLAFSKLGTKSKEFNVLRDHNIKTSACEWHYSWPIIALTAHQKYNFTAHIFVVVYNDVCNCIHMLLESVEQSIMSFVKYD